MKRNGAGHGVGGELSAACSRAGTRAIFEFLEFAFRHFSGSARANRFEHILNGDVVIVKTSRHDRSAVERKGRKIQASERHHRPGNGFIASADGDNRVEGVAANE